MSKLNFQQPLLQCQIKYADFLLKKHFLLMLINVLNVETTMLLAYFILIVLLLFLWRLWLFSGFFNSIYKNRNVV